MARDRSVWGVVIHWVPLITIIVSHSVDYLPAARVGLERGAWYEFEDLIMA